MPNRRERNAVDGGKAPADSRDGTPAGGGPDPDAFGSYRKILLLSGPLVLSQMGVMLMQVVDGLFLARYSQAAIAAIGPAGMAFWLFCGLSIGVVGYSGTFVAQYHGAGRPERVGPTVWQGIYLSLGAGAGMGAAAWLGPWIFGLAGHAPDIRAAETVYFGVLCRGGLAFVLSAALSGFFSGRNDNVPLMTAMIVGNVVNALGDWLLIFGHGGFPELGMRGAALAAVFGQAAQAVIMAGPFFSRAHRRRFATWRDRHLDLPLVWRICVHGFPNGFRFVIEILAWTMFLMLLGRVDPSGLAASNIVWRINGMAIFPVIGLSCAVSMLVGQAQGAGRPDLSRGVTRRGLIIGQVWMLAAALAMVAAPDALLDLFLSAGSPTDLELRGLAVVLLRFVAAYCLLDGVNIILMSVLAGAGDTRWMLLVSGGAHVAFLLVLAGLAGAGVGIHGFWLAATVFVLTISTAWVARFRSKAWEAKRVIEHAPLNIEPIPVPGA